MTFLSTRYQYLAGYILIVALTLASQVVAANDHRFKASIGGYIVNSFDTSLSLTDEDAGIGVIFNPEKTLDLDTEQSVFRLSGIYRFNRHHMLAFSWYQISSTGDVGLQEEISWIDENLDPITIPVGADVNTVLDYDIYKLGYSWSYYRTDQVELTLGAGLHVTRLDINLISNITSSGQSAERVNTTLPLPTVSVGLEYMITPKLSWNFMAEVFSVAYDDVRGIYSDTRLGLAYSLTNRFDLGVAMATNNLKLEEDTDDYQLIFDNRISGLLIYGSMSFF